MIEHNLRIGDALIVKRNRVVLLTKKTKKYWYYYLDGQEGRVSSKSLWEYIDSGDNHQKIHYGAPLKNRKRRKKERSLDLHGQSHAAADERIRNFLNFVDLPAQIITGKSEKMKEIVELVCNEYNFACKEQPENPGRFIVVEV